MQVNPAKYLPWSVGYAGEHPRFARLEKATLEPAVQAQSDKIRLKYITVYVYTFDFNVSLIHKLKQWY